MKLEEELVAEYYTTSGIIEPIVFETTLEYNDKLKNSTELDEILDTKVPAGMTMKFTVVISAEEV